MPVRCFSPSSCPFCSTSYLSHKGGDRTKLRSTAIRIFASLLILLVLVSAIKFAVNQSRPCDGQENCEWGSTFPSFHSANAFAIAILLTLAYPRFAVLLFPLAIAVAYSRVALNFHFVIDTIAGALIGFAVAIAIYFSKIEKFLSEIHKY